MDSPRNVKINEKHVYDECAVFWGDFYSESGATCVIPNASYYMKTDSCACRVHVFENGIKTKEYSGKGRKCALYPNGGCEILTEDMVKEFRAKAKV